ncbi:two-component system regulatory protein YycI [Oceanobacillus massiliensis]|uniref:two-component system regulatory protein YycI n=1 Tax=Oceanobacillus massiliensis TaxID=1465765 RepID=UPI00028867EE|nr:two-component system regulatory protein YycI [Oceanobacillus massiliensis]
MQWGHIKSLFILSFLILNIYLLFQFVERQRDSDVENLESGDNASLEEQLASENITITADTDQEVTEANYISASQRSFTNEEMEQLNSIDNLQATLSGTYFILSQFDKPIPVTEDADEDSITALVTPYLLDPDDYAYWGWDEELNIIMFFQRKEGRTVYLNQNALLLFYLNDKNEITHYTQTMLGEAKKQGNTESLSQPRQAIGSLYQSRDLIQDQEVTDVQLGFVSRINSEESQVFAPTWKVTVDGEKNYFVNAIEGIIYPGNDTEFLKMTLAENYMGKISLLPEDNELKAPATAVFNQKLEQENRSETE